MSEYCITRIIIQPDRSFLTYSEREAAVISHISVGRLRHLRVQGLIEGEMIDGRQCYREEDILQLRRMRRLQQDLGINLAGVEVIMRLLAQLDTIQRELALERKRKSHER